jgi:adenine deaminase
VAGGVPPAVAVRHASLIPARHYGLSDRGAVVPGFRADLLIVDDLCDFKARLVFKDGRLVARDGNYLGSAAVHRVEIVNTVKIRAIDESAFVLRLPRETFPVIRMCLSRL